MPTTENQKLAQELEKATPLKTYLESDDPAVEALVDKYLAVIKEERKATRSHDDKYRGQLNVLISNLVWVNTKKNQWISQGRGKPSYKKTRYFKGITKDIFVNGMFPILPKNFFRVRVQKIRANSSRCSLVDSSSGWSQSFLTLMKN